MSETVSAIIPTPALTITSEIRTPTYASSDSEVKRATSDLKDFFVEEERKLVEEYAARDEDGRIRVNENGRFALRAGACAADYEKARKELAETETGAEGEKIRVRAPETITPEQLEALAPWIEWEAEE